MLRVKVEGGGCSGMKYQIGLTTDIKVNDDIVFTKEGARVVIDNISITFLQDATLDYIEDLGGAMFAIKNPKFKSSCGCGASFAF